MHSFGEHDADQNQIAARLDGFLSAVGTLGRKLQYGAFRYQTHWGDTEDNPSSNKILVTNPQLIVIKNSKSHNWVFFCKYFYAVLFISINNSNDDDNNNKTTVWLRCR